MNILVHKHIKVFFSILLILNISNLALSQNNHKKFVLVLDAGHGGHDPGTRGVVKNEKTIALSITLKLGKLIENHFGDDVKVIYTRTSDVFIPLKERANIANRNKADFFVSIHCNAARASAHGTETFVLGTEAHRSNDNFSVVKKENSVILLEDDHEVSYEGFDPSSPESLIGLTLMQNVHLDNSLIFADAVEQAFINKDKRFSRGVKQAGFLVLWRTATPSVLIETGFISNSKEGRYLASEKGQNATAQSIFKAFKRYKHEWDLRNNIATEYVEDIPTKRNEPEKPKEQALTDRYFRIQVMSSRKRYDRNAVQFKGLSNVQREKVGGVYKYYYGKTFYVSERDGLLNYVKDKGFPDAFYVEVPLNQKDEIKQEESTKQDEPAKQNETQTDKKTGYRIQFFSSKTNYREGAVQLKGLKNIDKTYKKGLYRYYYGWYTTEAEAQQELSKVSNRGFRDAFVVRFKNGKKVNE